MSSPSIRNPFPTNQFKNTCFSTSVIAGKAKPVAHFDVEGYIPAYGMSTVKNSDIFQENKLLL
jgi:hypothetical protein